MTQIVKSSVKDASQLAELGRNTFIESHGHSASKGDVNNYLNENYTKLAFEKELANQQFIYHNHFYESELIGYSKIVFDVPCKFISNWHMAKLERIYLLQSYHGMGLGKELLQMNIDLAKRNGQQGVWLYTWIENKRAINFYKKFGFDIIGEYDFRISKTHTNPNWVMFLRF